jgi:hypothetical protein
MVGGTAHACRSRANQWQSGDSVRDIVSVCASATVTGPKMDEAGRRLGRANEQRHRKSRYSKHADQWRPVTWCRTCYTILLKKKIRAHWLIVI